VLQSGGRVEDHDVPGKVTRVSQYRREEGVLRAEAPRPRVFDSAEDEKAYPLARRVTEAVDDIGRVGVEDDEPTPPGDCTDFFRDVVFPLGKGDDGPLLALGDPESGSEVLLGVPVHCEDFPSLPRKAAGKEGCQGGLPDTTLPCHDNPYLFPAAG